MPLPLVLAAVALGGLGLKKGFDAKAMNKEAEEIGKRAEENYAHAIAELDSEKESTNEVLENLGRIKAQAFSTQIKHLVDVIKQHKTSSSKLENFQEGFSDTELLQLDHDIEISLEISNSLGHGAVAGALAAYGAYSGVGLLATASTGTAISSLSGAAATNATLAWLGGGSLATGGMGMAGGTMVLGSLVLGPALAVGGFMMASKAEETLTKAQEYEAEIDVSIMKIQGSMIILEAIQENADQLSDAIIRMANIFDSVKTDSIQDEKKFEKMMAVGVSLKRLLDTKIMDDNGEAIPHLRSTISGFMEHKDGK